MYFPVSGVEVFPLWPCISAFGISFLCSMIGVSGAFLLLPYQISVLGYVQPGVSATNQIFNILACPAGVWRYYKDGKLLLPLALFIAIGTLPGVFIGAILRLTLFVNNQRFMLFVALVLLYLAIRILRQKKSTAANAGALCANIQWGWHEFSFDFGRNTYKVRSLPLILLSLAVGLVGGIYGIGGGAIMSPVLVAFFGLPVYAIGGASLFATFLTSIAGTGFYFLLARVWDLPWAYPDLALGMLLGIGGIGGMYCGAMLQKRAPALLLRAILMAVLLFLGITYFLKGLGLL